MRYRLSPMVDNKDRVYACYFGAGVGRAVRKFTGNRYESTCNGLLVRSTGLLVSSTGL